MKFCKPNWVKLILKKSKIGAFTPIKFETSNCSKGKIETLENSAVKANKSIKKFLIFIKIIFDRYNGSKQDIKLYRVSLTKKFLYFFFLWRIYLNP